MQAHALLQAFHRRPALTVQGDDLPVEHSLGPGQQNRQRLQFRVLVGDVHPGLGQQPHASVAGQVGDDPYPVPERLVRVLRLALQPRSRTDHREHRRQRNKHTPSLRPAASSGHSPSRFHTGQQQQRASRSTTRP